MKTINSVIVSFLLAVAVIFYVQIGFSQNPKLSPGELFAAPGFKNHIPLHWEKNNGTTTQYKIFRKTELSDFLLIATQAPGSWSYATFIDNNVETGVEYTYIIKNQSDVAFTNESSATCNNTGFSLTIPGWNISEPIIDGILEIGEWDDALSADITDHTQIFGTTNWTQSTYAKIKYANEKLYIAVQDFNNLTLDNNDQLIILFDFNNDNLWSEGANGGNDGRLALVYFNEDYFIDFTEITGDYPNTTFGNSVNAPEGIVFAANVQNEALIYELEIDLNQWYIDLNDNNFGFMIQSLAYNSSGTSLGASGMYAPAGIWKAPVTFADCSIQFSEDTQAPVLNSVSELTALVDEAMEINLDISDESQLETVEAFYSINGGATQTLSFSPSKSNFGYSAEIPAQSTATTGSIQFHIKDIFGNEFNSESYILQWLNDTEAPYIIVLSAPEVATHGNIPSVSCEITDNLSGIQTVELHYSLNGQAYQVLELSSVSAIFSGTLPDGETGDYADYYITASDNSNNESNTDTYRIVWFAGGWFGATEAEHTGNNFGNSAEGMKLGIVMQLDDFQGKINKIAYMVPQYCHTNWSWSVVEVDASDLNNVVWTDNVLIAPQTYTENMVFDVNYWTEIEAESDVTLTGDVGFVIEMQAGSYWGRDAASTQGISWFLNTNTGQWHKMGADPYQSYGGDWTLKVHLYSDQGVNIEHIANENTFPVVFPNPTKDIISLNLPGIDLRKIEITDISGRTLSQQTCFTEKTQTSFDVSGFKPGIYYIKATFEHDEQIFKFVKQ